MIDMKIELTGTSPLLLHNVQLLADPDSEVSKEIKKITSKRKKTEEDRAILRRLEWHASLYVENGQIVMPTANIKAMLKEAAKITKRGKDITRALQFKHMSVPLVYDGPKEPEKLFSHPGSQHCCAVRIQKAVTMRTRPQFQNWSIVAEAMLLETVMDPDDLVEIVHLAGQAEGLCDYRSHGYGRFTASIRNGKAH